MRIMYNTDFFLESGSTIRNNGVVAIFEFWFWPPARYNASRRWNNAPFLVFDNLVDSSW